MGGKITKMRREYDEDDLIYRHKDNKHSNEKNAHKKGRDAIFREMEHDGVSKNR